ncbi:asparaginyl-tRNA synthetase [Hokovirus HKV1]|uniref:Asparaginyl-tRNA synthetase n=1 Tax=Hokovirus HKV1 TaxID=1977638 RepID=A0A1V0SF32_9VIRU|nr:asparaginyl-tRNA synthetase [Hokovirus HKV1]
MQGITKISDITKQDAEKIIQVQGWIEKLRKGKNTYFIDLIDSFDTSNYLQCIVPKDLIPSFEQVNRTAFIKIEGQIKELPAKYKTNKGVELHITKLLHHSHSKSDFDSLVPENSYSIKYHTLCLRHKNIYVLLTDLVLKSLQITSMKMDLVEVNAPLYGGTKCEGGSELYEMDHFGQTAYLTQSSQMYLEAIVPVVKKGVYCDLPSFRKEKSRTKRHLTQFRHFELEMFGFYTFDDFLQYLTVFIKTFFETLFDLDKDNILKKLNRIDFIKEIINKEFLFLRHEEAINMLNEQGITKSDGTKFDKYDDIPEAQERKLIDQLNRIVFLTHFPIMTKAFYTATDPQDKTRALAVDIEFPHVGEIFGCSLREQKRDRLEEKFKLFTLRDYATQLIDHLIEYNLDTSLLTKFIFEQDCQSLKDEIIKNINILKEIKKNLVKDLNKQELVKDLEFDIPDLDKIPYQDYEWYFQLRDYGFSNTGGFGLGVERLVTWLSGGDIIDGEHNYSIHSVTTFPRTVDKLYP